MLSIEPTRPESELGRTWDEDFSARHSQWQQGAPPQVLDFRFEREDADTPGVVGVEGEHPLSTEIRRRGASVLGRGQPLRDGEGISAPFVAMGGAS